MIAILLALALAWPPCGNIYLGLAPTFPPDGTWRFECINADGPWMLFYGAALPGAQPWGTYKGCDFWPAPPLTMLGPFVGDLYATFVPPGPMDGMWQVVSATQTSNGVHQMTWP